MSPCRTSTHCLSSPAHSTGLALAAVSHEVGDEGSLLHLHGVVRVGHLSEELEVPLELVVQAEDGRHVAAAVAIVGSGPNRYEVLVLEVVLVALHDELVGAADELDAIDVTELIRHFGAEDPTSTSGRDGPAWRDETRQERE
jgi:hypothetical protein